MERLLLLYHGETRTMNVYDFDKTIYDGDSTADFILWCIRKNPGLAVRFLPGAAAFGGYLLKLCSKTYFKEKFYGFLIRVPHVEQWVEEFWDEHLKNIKEWYLIRQREDDVIISASPEFLLRPACQRLRISHLLASVVDKDTGMYYGVNCHGEEKVRRFRKAFPHAVIDEFYSDSLSDAPLANLAKRAYLVKGDDLFLWED